MMESSQGQYAMVHRGGHVFLVLFKESERRETWKLLPVLQAWVCSGELPLKLQDAVTLAWMVGPSGPKESINKV